ncbi:hypothetical protein HZA42_00845 [Candidatus Peregrinibacteria bacterium]|nr:hypothetical protein [Candidatus Peregrinibacteria bacterium]
MSTRIGLTSQLGADESSPTENTDPGTGNMQRVDAPDGGTSPDDNYVDEPPASPIGLGIPTRMPVMPVTDEQKLYIRLKYNSDLTGRISFKCNYNKNKVYYAGYTGDYLVQDDGEDKFCLIIDSRKYIATESLPIDTATVQEVEHTIAKTLAHAAPAPAGRPSVDTDDAAAAGLSGTRHATRSRIIALLIAAGGFAAGAHYINQIRSSLGANAPAAPATAPAATKQCDFEITLGGLRGKTRYTGPALQIGKPLELSDVCFKPDNATGTATCQLRGCEITRTTKTAVQAACDATPGETAAPSVTFNCTTTTGEAGK